MQSATEVPLRQICLRKRFSGMQFSKQLHACIPDSCDACIMKHMCTEHPCVRCIALNRPCTRTPSSLSRSRHASLLSYTRPLFLPLQGSSYTDRLSLSMRINNPLSRPRKQICMPRDDSASSISGFYSLASSILNDFSGPERRLHMRMVICSTRCIGLSRTFTRKSSLELETIPQLSLQAETGGLNLLS